MTGISLYFSNIWGGWEGVGEGENMLVLPDIMLWVSIWHLEPNFFSVQGITWAVAPSDLRASPHVY